MFGCAPGPNSADPWEKTNRSIYNFNSGLDRVALKPLADGYVKVVPQPVRTGIGNGFANLVYLDVVLNDFLQKKTDQGFSDLKRFAVNTTVGVVGIFDVATGWSLPAHTNDFGLTLRRWGTKTGPYLVLPLFGPSTVTDAPDIGVKYLVTPTTWLDLPLQVAIPLAVTGIIDTRSRFDSMVRFRNTSAIDPYVFTREGYLQYREEQAHGATHTDRQDLYSDEADDAAPATTQPTPN